MELESKMAVMEYLISNIKLQLHKEEHLGISNYYFSQLYCYTAVLENVTDLFSVRPHIWKTFNQAVLEGYVVNRRMHPFVLVDYEKMADNNYENKGYSYEICIPVIKSGDISKLKYMRATDTLSTVIYGGSKDIGQAFVHLLEEKNKRNIQLEGRARVLAVVNSYPGEDIPFEHWVTRICIPIKEK